MLKEASQGLCADQLLLRLGMCCKLDVCRRAGLHGVVGRVWAAVEGEGQNVLLAGPL